MNKDSHLPQTKCNDNTVMWRFCKRNHLRRRFHRFREAVFRFDKSNAWNPKIL